MAGILSRFGAALVARAEGAAERFISSTSAELRAATRASNADPDPSWMRIRAAIEDDSRGKRPPTEEYQDFPVSVWQDWTIASIRGAVQSHVNGAFSQAAILVESMLADDRIQTATNGRIKGVTKCQPVFEPNGSKKAVKELEKLWPEIIPEELLDQLLTWSIFLGFALCEVIWETRDDRWVPRLKIWHPLYIYYRIDLRKYVAISTEGSIEIDPDDPKWFLFTPWGSYRGWLRGAVRSCSIPWVVRQFALRDWGRFSEVHGLPIKKLMVPSQAPAEDKARFMASIARLGSESQFMLPQQSSDTGGMGPGSFDVQLLEAKDRAWEAFPGLIHQAERSITLAIRGTNLTTELDGGSFAAADVHRDEDSDYSISDRRKLASAIKAQLLRPFCLYNYGDADVAPSLQLVSPESDQQTEADVLVKASTAFGALEGRGWRLDRDALAQRYNIPILPPAPDQPVDGPKIELTPTDQAAITKVNEGRAIQNLPPIEGPDGDLTIDAYRAKNAPAKPGFGGGGGFAKAEPSKPQQVELIFTPRAASGPKGGGREIGPAFLVRATPRAEFDEDNITRDDHGKFSSGGGGGSDGSDSTKGGGSGGHHAPLKQAAQKAKEATLRRKETAERARVAHEKRNEIREAIEFKHEDRADELAAADAEVQEADKEYWDAVLDQHAATTELTQKSADRGIKIGVEDKNSEIPDAPDPDAVADAIEAAEKVFGGKVEIDHAGVHQILGVPEGVKFEGTVKAKDGALVVTGQLSDDKGEIGDITRTYSQGESGLEVHHDFFVINDDRKGQGVGGPIIRSQIEQYEKLGVSEVKLLAAWDGRYVWPKMGFESSDRDEMRSARKRFDAYLKRRGESPAKAKALRDIVDHPLGKAFMLGPRAPMLSLSATPKALRERMAERTKSKGKIDRDGDGRTGSAEERDDKKS